MLLKILNYSNQYTMKIQFIHIFTIFIVGIYAQAPPHIQRGRSNSIVSDGEGIIGESFNASPGQTITIRANDLTGIEHSLFNWFRIPQGETEFISIVSDTTFSITTSQNEFTESSITFTAESDTYGTYKAEAINSAGTDEVVSEVGQSPRVENSFSIISVRSGQSRTVDVGAYVNIEEDGSVTLIATDLVEQPERYFTWTYKNNPTDTFQPISVSAAINQSAVGNTGYLTLSDIDRSYHGEYSVIATNVFGESSAVSTIVGGPPLIRSSTGTETDGEGEIGNDFLIPLNKTLRITACVVMTYPPADPTDFIFEEQGVALISSQQPAPNDNCFIYEERNFELTCGTTISARTSNFFGFSNQPSSDISFPAPKIVASSSTCDKGSFVNSAEIGSELCLYNMGSFEISCSLERTNIPFFSFQWLLNDSPISQDIRYSISSTNLGNSILSVSDITIEDTGRYTCETVSACGGSDSVSTNVSIYAYENICVEGKLECYQSMNGGTQTRVENQICDELSVSRPPCEVCGVWVVGQWSSCSDTTCESGKRYRQVVCSCDGEEKPDSNCMNIPKPVAMEMCGPIGIRCVRPFEWRTYTYLPCSSSCGYSIRTRQVECISQVTTNRVKDEECSFLIKPPQYVICNVPPCF